MNSLNMRKAEASASLSDLESLQIEIGHKLPDDFKEFYIQSNGGIPDRDWWDSHDEYEPIRVKRFKSVATKESDNVSDTKYLGGCYSFMTSKDVIPSTLLPFATDDGGNFFCLDLIDGNICFYATDSFDPSSSTTSNHTKATRWLASSFSEFIEDLKDESDIDI